MPFRCFENRKWFCRETRKLCVYFLWRDIHCVYHNRLTVYSTGTKIMVDPVPIFLSYVLGSQLNDNVSEGCSVETSGNNSK